MSNQDCIRFLSLSASVWHGLRPNVNPRMPWGHTLCGRRYNYTEIEREPREPSCKNCIRILKERGYTKQLLERREVARSQQEPAQWGGSRPGAGRPPKWVKLSTKDFELLRELVDTAADLLTLDKYPVNWASLSNLSTALEAVEATEIFSKED